MTGKGVDKMSEIEKQMYSKLSQIRQILEETPGRLCSPCQQVQNGGSINKQGPGHEVGIFSMEVMDPGWLKAALNSRFFNRWVNKSKYTISKDTKKKDSISGSTFCIFLTDQFMWNVTSSLEKSQAFKEFGSKPHIVVIDDAEDSGDAKKKKLLKDLTMSKIYIKDLFLFSKLEKECDFMTNLNGDDRTDSMPIGKGVDTLTMFPATPDQYRHVTTAHGTHMMSPLVPIQAVPKKDRHDNSAPAAYIIGVDTLAPFPATPNLNKAVSSSHAAHTMHTYENQYPPVLIPAMPDQDRHVSTQHVATMMGVNMLAPLPATLNPDRPVASHHAAHLAASTIKEGHGNNSHLAHTMGKELLVVISPTSSQDRFNNSSCPTQIAGPLVPIQAVPKKDRHDNSAPASYIIGVDTLAPFPATPNLNKAVSSSHAAHTMHTYENQYSPVLVPAMPDQDRHVSTQHVATMMGGISGVNISAPLPGTLHPDRPVSSHHAAHPAASTIKEGHGIISHPTHTMGEELLVVISPTSGYDRFNNSSCPTQIAGKDLLLSIPSIARQRRCAKTYSPANVMDPPVPASSTPNQPTSVCTTDPKDTIDVSYSNEPKTNISLEQQPGKKYSIGIFSRSSDEDYSWLVELLTSEYFKNSIQKVKPCYISNNGFQRFIEDLSECTLGILYHTKNRGRVNITNVNDSLYDEELDYLEQMLGKDNVLVVVDDLEDSSDQEKTRILKNQPDIGRLASHLLLISHTEKAEKMQLVGKLKSVIQ